MKVTDFLDEVTIEEGGKVSLNRAEVGEVAKLINKKLDGQLYKLIRQKKIG